MSIAVDSNMDDAADMRQARNRALYDGYKNSIIEWTLSERWTTAPNHPHIRYECVKTYASGKKLAAVTVQGTDVFYGEIECP